MTYHYPDLWRAFDWMNQILNQSEALTRFGHLQMSSVFWSGYLFIWTWTIDQVSQPGWPGFSCEHLETFCYKWNSNGVIPWQSSLVDRGSVKRPWKVPWKCLSLLPVVEKYHSIWSPTKDQGCGKLIKGTKRDKWRCVWCIQELVTFSKKVAILFTFQFTDELDTLVIATCSNFI